MSPVSSLREVQSSSGAGGLNVLVPFQCQSLKTHAVVDTAAMVSLISMEKFQSICPGPLSGEAVRLHNAEKGSSMIAHFVPKLEFWLGHKQFTWNFYVAPITDDVLLGLDFLKSKKVIVDLQNDTLVMKDF